MPIELTQDIGRRITTVTEDTRETTFLFQRLSMALQRGNEKQPSCFNVCPWLSNGGMRSPSRIQ